MPDLIHPQRTAANMTMVDQPSLDQQVATCPHVKIVKSGSKQTRATYAATITCFLTALQEVGLDLDARPNWSLPLSSAGSPPTSRA
jgi:hypothetical protein